MDANQNHLSEREWTIDEFEEFFKSQDAVTGLFSGEVASNASWMNAPNPTGIHVTSIVPPELGWPVAYHCPLCRTTTFVLSPWATKPKDGDYWRMNEMCSDEVNGFAHNMRMGMKGWKEPVDLKPSPSYFIEGWL